MNENRRLLLKALALQGMALAPYAHADNYPQRPISLILPFGPGGATDNVVRMLAEKAGQKLGQAIVIENRPGASGMLGANHVAKAKADGYSLAIAPEPIFSIPYLQKAQFDPVTDFTYIIQLSGYALSISANANSSINSWKDVVEKAKAQPEKLSYGTTGINGTMHLTMEKIANSLNIKLNHVAFKGEAEIINALMGNHIDLAITAGSIAPMVEAKKAKPLLVWTKSRVKKWPDTPTLSDIGLNWVATAPFGVIGPRNLDPSITRKLHDAFKFALEEQQTKNLLESLNQEASYLSSDDYQAYASQAIKASKSLFPAGS